MDTAEASAPAKAILIGEHAVVFGRTAVAVPLTVIRARARCRRGNGRGEGVFVEAPDLGIEGFEDEFPAIIPLSVACRAAYEGLGIPMPPLSLQIDSDIPVARGLGSGAAVAVATIRACAALEERLVDDGLVSDHAFRVEILHHGKPSGIDNTVVAFEKPIVFARSKPPRVLSTPPLLLVFADSGIPSKTSTMVAALARRRDEDPDRVERLFDGIEAEVITTVDAMVKGDLGRLGEALSAAHGILAALGVSCGKLDALVSAAKDAGALGAKLSGAGGGGYMLALAPDPDVAEKIAEDLRRAGGVGVFATNI